MNKELIPAIIQHALTGQVLMLGYMDSESIKKTQEEKKVVFYSRSKKRLWMKGEVSGNYLRLVSMVLDCDQDTYLIKVIPEGNTCHKNTFSCFGNKENQGFLYELEHVIQGRKDKVLEDSYTSSLLREGTKKISKKIVEEAGELIIEAMDRNKALLLQEISDLLYHLIVLFVDQDISLAEVEKILFERHQKP